MELTLDRWREKRGGGGGGGGGKGLVIVRKRKGVRESDRDERE